MSKNPMQPIFIAEDGVIRFKENRIVRDLVDLANKHGTTLNHIVAGEYSKDDYSQLMQLIGYSVSGYGDLSQSRRKHVKKADRIAAEMIARLEPKP